MKSSDFGLYANSNVQEASKYIKIVIDSARVLCQNGYKVTIKFDKGKYYFRPEEYNQYVYYISNHDQCNPKHVGIVLENVNNVTIDGCGAEFLFYGQMLPLALTGSRGCTLENFSIDFPVPHIAQAEIISNDNNGTVKYKMADWDNWYLEDGSLHTRGTGWQYHADYAIAFDGATRHIIPGTSDLFVHTANLSLEGKDTICSHDWKDCKLKPGTRLALRTWDRPAPAVFLADDVSTRLRNVKVHYAEGMGLVAQMCEDIDLDGFSVCLRGEKDPRYFTTQADATHFSGCKGLISVRNGLYESMMDDAINVHGTYLKIIGKENANTVLARYMHDQTFGFRWGEKGDTVNIVRSKTMEYLNFSSRIKSVSPVDGGLNDGVKTFRIELEDNILGDIDCINDSYGLENVTWTPRVVFRNNVVRNNRARGALFSTPRKVVAEGNLFDHTSGCAILLCGDCNGWFETGPCRDVLITKNKFVNALTNVFQFTNAVISICPEIPDLDGQEKYFHQNVRITDNYFETFDYPLLYAKSVDGIQFSNNKVCYNKAFAPYHWNKKTFSFDHVRNTSIVNNKIVSRYRLVDGLTEQGDK